MCGSMIVEFTLHIPLFKFSSFIEYNSIFIHQFFYDQFNRESTHKCKQYKKTGEIGPSTSWQLYQLVTFRRKKIRFVTALDLIKCLKQIKYQILLLACAPISKVPSQTSAIIQTDLYFSGSIYKPLKNWRRYSAAR